MNKGFIGAVAIGAVLIGGVGLGVSCLERVPTGYVGVVYNMNGGRRWRSSKPGILPCSPY